MGLRRSLAGAGIDIDSLTDRASFRALVDSTDVGSEAGRMELNALLSAAEGFAGIADYLEKSGQTLGELAGLAPAIGALGDLNTDSGIATVDGLATLDGSVLSIGNQITASIEALQASLEAGLAAVAVNTAEMARQLNSWDDGGALVTTPESTGG